MAITRRNLTRVKNDPEQLLDAMLMPMVLALIFIYVFGGAIAGNHADYRQYLMPGIMVETASFASRATGIGLNLDFTTGVMDRFRSLPIARSVVLSGRIVAELCRMVLGQIVMLIFAVVIGFRMQTGLLSILAAYGLILLFGMALCWVSAFIGLSLRSPQTVQTLGFLWMLPLQFGSSMFAPPETMPGWLRAFAQVNPMTAVVDSCRGLLVGGPVTTPVITAVAWSVGLIVVFGPLAVWRYRTHA
ncbi:ABC transporter permease [Saccharopolyspora pogona]|uniref:ABC transporter permease n=1 Tax=Saccharopolyspora pogona TaxID=333966 RepID=UPI001CC238B6|nr:ABC transporter permease [Saccharopolyspora pogona]